MGVYETVTVPTTATDIHPLPLLPTHCTLSARGASTAVLACLPDAGLKHRAWGVTALPPCLLRLKLLQVPISDCC